MVQCSIAACATVFSADAASRAGLPDPELTYHADWEYWLRLARLGATVYHRTPLASFRLHCGSQTIARADEAGDRLAQARLVQEKYLWELNGLVLDHARLARVAQFSSHANHALNRVVAGQAVEWSTLLRQAAGLGPQAAQDFLRDSRIVERCLSRLQAGVGPRVFGLRALRVASRAWRERTPCCSVAAVAGSVSVSGAGNPRRSVPTLP